MKNKTFLTALISVFLLAGANSALADDCVALGGAIVAGECRVSGAHNVAAGTYTLDETLHVLTGGSIVITPPPPPPPFGQGITIIITTGDLLMDNGSLIDGNNGDCGFGSAITIQLNNGDIDLDTGSIIRSNSCSGGPIVLTTTASHTANIDGAVLSVGSRSGDGSGSPGGGPIRIVAGCSLTVSDTGLVSSRGRDPGADLVHLEGCTVTIFGIVESTADGHVNPTKPANHCNDGVHLTSPPPSSFFAGCIEIWSGTTVTIDGTPPHRGELNADIGASGGQQGRGWIDIYANGNINIVDGTGNDHNIPTGGCGLFLSTFAVHSNGGLCQNTDDGGLITIKSLGGSVAATGNAIQASATSAGSRGGEVHVEADQNINFNGATLEALGDNNGVGGFGIGGKLGTTTATMRAFHGTFSWTAGVGDVRPTGTTPPPANRGEINVQGCGAPTLGATFPVTGLGAQTNPVTNSPTCAGPGVHPTKATTGDLPGANCIESACQLPSSKSGTKFFDTSNNHQRDGGEPGLANWEIKAFQGGVEVASALTDAAGAYTLNLLPGSYTVCEVQQAGFTQTCPQGPFPNGFGCAPGPAAITNAADCTALTGGGVGYAITLLSGEHEVGNDFGNFRGTPVCPEDPKAILSRSVGNPGSGVPNYDTLQAAYDAAGSGETIGMFSKTKENVVLGGDKTLKITQCTSARITALDSSQPVWTVSSTGKLTIVGPDSVGGTIGWLVGGNGGHTLKSIRANGATQYGVKINSDKNEVSWNDVSGNGVGILVNGSKNVLKGGTVGPNTGDGVQIAGGSNSLSGATVQNNGGDGVNVTGGSNTIKSNKANSNTHNGFNNAAGASNNYSGNSSNTGGKENGDAEYRFTTAGVNGGSNRADGINVPKTTTPTKCANFAQAGSVCE